MPTEKIDIFAAQLGLIDDLLKSFELLTKGDEARRQFNLMGGMNWADTGAYEHYSHALLIITSITKNATIEQLEESFEDRGITFNYRGNIDEGISPDIDNLNQLA